MLFDDDHTVDEIEVRAAVVTDDVAAVRIHAHVDGQDWTGEGSAKRHPKDSPNRSLGITLATSRAFADLAEKLLDEVKFQLDDEEYDFKTPIVRSVLGRLSSDYIFGPTVINNNGFVREHI